MKEQGLNQALEWIDEGGQGPVFLCDADHRGWRRELLDSCPLVEAAGGWVLDRKGRSLWILRLGRWDLPKGKKEPGEKVEETAEREVLEETGVSARIIDRRPRRGYHLYREKGEIILKQTYWFRMQAIGDPELIPQREEGIEALRWVPREQWNEYLDLTYPNIRHMLKGRESGEPWVPDVGTV